MSEIETIKWIMEQGYSFVDAAYLSMAVLNGVYMSDALALLNKSKEAVKLAEDPDYKALCYITQDEWDEAIKGKTLADSYKTNTIKTDYGVTREQTGKSFNETYPTTPKRCC